MVCRWSPFIKFASRFLFLVCLGLTLVTPESRWSLPESGTVLQPQASEFRLHSESSWLVKTKRALPSLQEFTSEVMDGDGDAIRGVYVSGILALPVVQQPEGAEGFVSNDPSTVTEYQRAAQNNVIGLLAHNYLAGKDFFRLRKGQEVIVLYGDGTSAQYLVTRVHRYQKLDPFNLYSDYVNLSSGKHISTVELFNRVYRGPHHVTFQTCLARGGNLEWGLLFIIADPVVEFR
jgi:hypothetical protein